MPNEVLRQVPPENLDDQVSEVAFEPEMTLENLEISTNPVDESPKTEYRTTLDTKNHLDGFDPMFANKIKQILSRLSQKEWHAPIAVHHFYRGKASITPPSTGRVAPVVGVALEAKKTTALPTCRPVTLALSKFRLR